jgi:hypothetical protein
MNALLASKACDITGVVAIACARHGCYAPNTLVDMFLGEQQKHVDFGLLKTILLTHVDPEQGLLLIYDIVCQFIVHLLDRIGHLLPEGLHVDAAIGLFHVHAHKDDCFFRFASSFIPGAGIVAGEILESLWSTLNSISPSARTATLAHRAELLDDHATDSNHRKMLGMVSSLCKNFKKATDMSQHAQEYYANLTEQAGPAAVAAWEIDIREAEACRMQNRPAMDLYATKLDTSSVTNPAPVDPSSLALDRWMDLALLVEEKQLSKILVLLFGFCLRLSF